MVFVGEGVRKQECPMIIIKRAILSLVIVLVKAVIYWRGRLIGVESVNPTQRVIFFSSERTK